MQASDHFSALLVAFNKQLEGLSGVPRHARMIELAHGYFDRSSTEFERKFWATVIAKTELR